MNAPDVKVSRRSNLDPGLLGRTPALPIASFVDAVCYERELARLFRAGPNYVGHRSMVPTIGDYIAVPASAGGKALVHGPGGLRLLSNVCRHRQARILGERGRTENIVCPLHRWTYDLNGRLLGAPEFEPAPAGCSLASTPLIDWNGLQFAGPRDAGGDLVDFPLASEYDWSGYVFDRVVVDECAFNWKEFLEIFLELYHVEPTHPGLQQWVDAGNYEWGFGERWSYQILGVNDGLRTQVSPHYARYRDALLKYTSGGLPKFGSIWAILYPNVMIEWYPCALVVSTLVPRGPDHTTNIVEFYYPEEVQAFERELVEAHQAAYAESAAEDAANCERLHQGRRALWLSGEDDAGPFQSPHEDGIIHFCDWYRREMESTAGIDDDKRVTTAR